MRMRWSFAMPAGMSTSTDWRALRRPRPRQSGHGTEGVSPAPWHSGQTSARTIWPMGVRATRRTWPWPPQVAQRTISLPGAPPEPSQVSQAATTS